jgi:hypothetical protein
MSSSFTPREIVSELDRYIVGQHWERVLFKDENTGCRGCP